MLCINLFYFVNNYVNNICWGKTMIIDSVLVFNTAFVLAIVVLCISFVCNLASRKEDKNQFIKEQENELLTKIGYIDYCFSDNYSPVIVNKDFNSIKTNDLTHIQKLDLISDELYDIYYDIKEYAINLTGAKSMITRNYEKLFCKKWLLMRMKIVESQGAYGIKLQFNLHNLMLTNKIKSEVGTPINYKSSDMIIKDYRKVEQVKKIINIVYNQYLDYTEKYQSISS